MKLSPKDFFVHLGAAIALYIAGGALISLWFSVINYYRPDVLAGYFYANSVAWPISLLVILVPTLYVLERYIIRDMVREPQKAHLWIYTWRIYVTLFIVTILVGGDLIALINTYLNGEISSRFVYKVIAVLLVAGTVGKYYFFRLYPEYRWARMSRTINPWFGIVLTVVAIGMGFAAVGSPATQRALRMDMTRVSDLSSLQSQIVSYWQQKNALPPTLEALNDQISGYSVPTDPETKAPYEYRLIATTTLDKAITFELCAVFSRAAQDTQGRGEYGYGGVGMMYPSYDMSYPIMDGQDTWKHQEGRACFTRTIDPDKYAPNILPTEKRSI